MKRYQKIAILGLVMVCILAVGYYIAPGFLKNGSVYISEYTVSEENEAITLKIGVAASMGYIRNISVHQQQDGKLYLDCYSAFGGANGSIGAKSEYVIPLEADTKMIALYRSPDCYEPVLEKDAYGQWQRSQK